MLHGFDGVKALNVNAKKKEAVVKDYQFIAPVSSFDPFYAITVTDMTNDDIPFIEFENTNDEITITW